MRIVLAQLAFMAFMAGTGLGTRQYRGHDVPAGTAQCKDTSGFVLDTYQRNYKCFKPYQGDIHDPTGPSLTCVCENDELCKARGVSVSSSSSNTNGDGNGNPNEPSGNAGSLDDANSFEYMCINATESARILQQHENVAG